MRLTGRLTACVAAGTVLSPALAIPSAPRANPAVISEPRDNGDIATAFVADLVHNATQEDSLQTGAAAGKSCGQVKSLTVDVGYAKYEGYHNETTALNYWKGIRYAAAPTGKLRWQPPQTPAQPDDVAVTKATSFGPICPQAMPAVPGIPFIPGDEDCLFLNVYAPEGAKGLPVLVYIHGGGYGYGDGTQDMAEIINSNDKKFIAVTIQYRLGAFGFLSSEEVKQNGVVNAGILDQAFALAWIKKYICQFGGDASSVTIAGESAGASSVMYHDLAQNGKLGSLLFGQSIAASPYLPFQYAYDDPWPTNKYSALAEEAGCTDSTDVFSCLVGKDSDTLQQANHAVTQQSTYGYWAFYPVTDGAYIMGLASEQLVAKKVNGKKLLVGHNANEGPLFVPPTITTEDDLIGWLHLEFPNLSDADIDSILSNNPNDEPTDPTGPRFETSGLDGPSAVTVSQDANGQQQRGNNIYAEATFVCPSYWMASAYANSQKSWHYQYSVPFAFHTTDINAYFGPRTPNQSEDLALAFRRIWGNFIVGGDPSLSDAIANGAAAADEALGTNAASKWPVWSDKAPKMLNINETGGVAYEFTTQWGVAVTQFMEPGLRNALSVVPADSWEDGRGSRCDFYKKLAPSIPA